MIRNYYLRSGTGPRRRCRADLTRGEPARRCDPRGMSRRSASPIRIARALALDLVAIVRLSLQSQARLAAENLFLRKQLALYEASAICLPFVSRAEQYGH